MILIYVYCIRLCRDNGGYLCRGEAPNVGIDSWDWNMTGEKSTYHALYPRSWTVYEGTMLFCNHVYYLDKSIADS